MNPRAAWRAAVRAVEARDGCLAVRGWHLIGPGPARFGWALRFASGHLRWLGRTRADAMRALRG